MIPRGHPRSLLVVLLIVGALIAGCGGAASPTGTTGSGPYREEMAASAPTASTGAYVQDEASQPTGAAEGEAAGPTEGGEGGNAPAPTAIGEKVAFNTEPNRKIIKNGDMTLEVENVEVAMGRVNAAVIAAGGYVLETRTDFNRPEARMATMSVAVPVDQFEATMQKLREAGVRVINEQASGKDATQEYVDVQSQIANLEATQSRIREFLEQANTVDEALRVNQQLTEIEGQISVLKGRLQFLGQRAAFSTITVVLQQQPPALSPTPTITPAPSPTPAPIWQPEKTAGDAYATLTTILAAVGSVLIWLAIVAVPLLLPVAGIALAVRYFRRRAATPRRSTPPGRVEEPGAGS